MADRRKAFHFDLDEKLLEAIYPSDNPTAYKSAWGKIRAFMESNGFEHTQYSGYESIHGMTYYQAFNVIEKLQDAYPWFEKCAQVATVTEVGRRHDALAFLRRNNAPKSSLERPLDEEISLKNESRDMKDAADKLGKDGPEVPNQDIER